MLKPAISAAILTVLLLPTEQQDVATSIDAFVQAEMKKQNIPGVSVAVVRTGQLPLIRSYGLANIEHQVPVTPETIFQSGSARFSPASGINTAIWATSRLGFSSAR